MSKDKPNILLITTDQQRHDSLGCYGFKAGYTPNFDQMAKEGVVFDNHYTTNPVCTPTRSSIHTGKHLPGHSVYKLYDDLPEDEVLFPKKLQETGYKTALVGKLHVMGRLKEEKQRHPNDGFDEYEWCLEPSISLDSQYNGYSKWLQENHPEFFKKLSSKGRSLHHFPQEVHMTHWAAERTIHYIDEWGSNQPFFIEMSVFDPHNPYQDYPKEMLGEIEPDKIPDPLVEEVNMEEKPEAVQREHENSYLGSFDDFSEEQLHRMRVGYHASIAFLDQEFGKVKKALERKGILDETLIIFTSDHGDMLGDHQLLVKGAFFYDPCTKVPLIIRWPERIEGGKRVTELSQPHDITSTILSAAGYPDKKKKNEMPESNDLVQLAEDRDNEGHEFAICIYRNTGINKNKDYFEPPIYATMIRGDRYKLNLYHDLTFKDGIEGELFDMKNDQNELNNLWDDPEYQSVRRRLTERLLDWEVTQELKLGTRGGESLPSSSEKLENKPS